LLDSLLQENFSMVGPSFYIETGWENVLSEEGETVWISKKQRNEKGEHTNIKRKGVLG